MSTAARSIDRRRAPQPGTARPFRFPEVESRRLANGLRLLAAHSPRSPIATAKFLVPAGGQHNPASRPGLANVLGVLLHQGTTRLSAARVIEKVEHYGGSLESGASWDAAFVEARLLARHLDSCLEILVDSVRRPALEEQRSKRVRRLHRDHVMRRLAAPLAWAEDVFSLLVYGQSAYAYPLAGTPESLGAMEHGEIVSAYHRLVRPQGSTIIVAGDIDRQSMLDRLEALVEDWPASEHPVDPPILEPARPKERRICIVDHPRAAQAHLVIGHAAVPGDHPDHFALSFLSSVLGDGVTSRLNRRLREELGLTYGVRTRLASRCGPGPFTVQAAVETSSAGRAAAEILSQLQLLAEEPLGGDELREAREHVLGALPFACQTLTAVALRIEHLDRFGLPLDHHDGLPELYAALDGADLQYAAAEHLDPQAAVVVAAGPADELEAQFEALGTVHVHRLG